MLKSDPFFMEIIQREGASGFGSGNVAALYRSVQEYIVNNQRKRVWQTQIYFHPRLHSIQQKHIFKQNYGNSMRNQNPVLAKRVLPTSNIHILFMCHVI